MKTRTQNGTWLGAAVTLALAAGAAQGQVTSFHMIGSLAGTNNYSSGYGISDDGSVCVGHSGNNFYYGSSSHAFRSATIRSRRSAAVGSGRSIC